MKSRGLSPRKKARRTSRAWRPFFIRRQKRCVLLRRWRIRCCRNPRQKSGHSLAWARSASSTLAISSGRSFRWAASWAKWNRCSRAPTKLQSRGCNRWNRSAQVRLPPPLRHQQPPTLQLLLPQEKAHARDNPQPKLHMVRPRLRLRLKQRRLLRPQQPAADGKISIDDFMKVELRVGQVKAAEKVKGADKLLRLGSGYRNRSPAARRGNCAGLQARRPHRTQSSDRCQPSAAQAARAGIERHDRGCVCRRRRQAGAGRIPGRCAGRGEAEIRRASAIRARFQLIVFAIECSEGSLYPAELSSRRSDGRTSFAIAAIVASLIGVMILLANDFCILSTSYNLYYGVAGAMVVGSGLTVLAIYSQIPTANAGYTGAHALDSTALLGFLHR